MAHPKYSIMHTAKSTPLVPDGTKKFINLVVCIKIIVFLLRNVTRASAYLEGNGFNACGAHIGKMIGLERLIVAGKSWSANIFCTHPLLPSTTPQTGWIWMEN